MKKQLAIKGHLTRGKEVIEILEMLGANNKENYTGNDPDALYILDNDNNIDIGYSYDNRVVFELEEFLEKFPFKIDDIVISDNYFDDGIIREMFWDQTDCCVKYCVEGPKVITWSKYNEIKFSNMSREDDKDPLHELCEDICENKLSTLMIDSEVCKDEVEIILNDYEIVTRGDKTYAVKKKPKYPKTYEECCGVLGMTYDFPDIKMVSIDEYYLYSEFIRLIRCRDAYWKIAGEEMELGKSWDLDWEKSDSGYVYCIINKCNNIGLTCEWIRNNYILAFPTGEMRDCFYNNFKELIEKCKKLL